MRAHAKTSSKVGSKTIISTTYIVKSRCSPIGSHFISILNACNAQVLTTYQPSFSFSINNHGFK
jgi:hypothetical protein